MAKNKIPMGAAFDADGDDSTLPPVVSVRTVKAAKAAPVTEKRVRIMLEENENIPPTGQFISINGRTFILKPGEAADVPECVINVLNDAVQSTPQLDSATKQVTGYRQKLRFPYRVLREAA